MRKITKTDGHEGNKESILVIENKWGCKIHYMETLKVRQQG